MGGVVFGIRVARQEKCLAFDDPVFMKPRGHRLPRYVIQVRERIFLAMNADTLVG